MKFRGLLAAVVVLAALAGAAYWSNKKEKAEAGKPAADPKCEAARWSTTIAMPKPIRPHEPFAITAAVAGPPMRGCRISIRLE